MRGFIETSSPRSRPYYTVQYVPLQTALPRPFPSPHLHYKHALSFAVSSFFFIFTFFLTFLHSRFSPPTSVSIRFIALPSFLFIASSFLLLFPSFPSRFYSILPPPPSLSLPPYTLVPTFLLILSFSLIHLHRLHKLIPAKETCTSNRHAGSCTMHSHVTRSLIGVSMNYSRNPWSTADYVRSGSSSSAPRLSYSPCRVFHTSYYTFAALMILSLYTHLFPCILSLTFAYLLLYCLTFAYL